MLLLICETLGIKGTSPENYVSHRWLSVYDVHVSVDTECILDQNKKHNVDKNMQEGLKELQNKMKLNIKRITNKE